MNMKIKMIIAAAGVLVAVGSAQAQITLGTTYTGHYTSGADQLTVAYTVTEAADVYTYDYVISTAPTETLTSFTIGGQNDQVDTDTAAFLNYGKTVAGSDAITDDSIDFVWNANAKVTSDEVSFTSDLGPALYSFTLNDDGIEWQSPPPIAAPAAVPEASTIMAGALMLLPLGAGAFRVLRKERMA
ncbi:MAG TPA: hypothetical protein VGI03_09105 [Verrucomicrobiae bacterium]|jgi:hypothetical protein